MFASKAPRTRADDGTWQQMRGIYGRILCSAKKQAAETWYNQEADSSQRRAFKSIAKGIYRAASSPVSPEHPLLQQAKICAEVYTSSIIDPQFHAATAAWLCRNPNMRESFISIFSSLSNTSKCSVTSYEEFYSPNSTNRGIARQQRASAPPEQSPLGSISRLCRADKLTWPTDPGEIERRGVMETGQSFALPLKRKTLLKKSQTQGELADKSKEVATSYTARESAKRFGQERSGPPWAQGDVTRTHQSESKDSYTPKRSKLVETDRNEFGSTRGIPTFNTGLRTSELTAPLGVISSGHGWADTLSPATRQHLGQEGPLFPDGQGLGSAADHQARPHTVKTNTEPGYMTTYSSNFQISPKETTRQKDSRRKEMAVRREKQGAAVPWDCQAEGFTNGALQTVSHHDAERTQSLLKQIMAGKPARKMH